MSEHRGDPTHPHSHVAWPQWGQEVAVAVDSNRPALRLLTCYRLGAAVRIELGNEHFRSKIVMNLESGAARDLAQALLTSSDNLDEARAVWFDIPTAQAVEVE